MAVARHLDKHPKVARVYFPGLESSPYHALAKRQMLKFGGMVCFDLAVGALLVVEGRMLAAGGHRSAEAAITPDVLGGLRPGSRATPRAGGVQRDVASDPEEMIQTIRNSQRKGEGRGAALLLRLLENPDTPPFYREEAAKLLRDGGQGLRILAGSGPGPEQGRDGFDPGLG